MLAFTNSATGYRNAGLAILLLQISLFALALKPFYYGTWYQVEPTVLGLFILATCNALWLAIGFTRRWLIFHRPLHPLFLCLFAWVVWQWLATAHALSPWRSWFGQPGIGEGVGFYTAMLLSYLLAYPLWKETRYRKIIAVAAVLGLVVMAWLHFDPATLCALYEKPESENLGMPGNWADYLPFLAGYLWIALLATPQLRTPTHYFWMTVITGFIVFRVAGSLAALVLFKPPLILGGIILWIHVVRRPKWLRPSRFWKTLAILGCVLPAIWIGVSESPEWSRYARCSLPTRALLNQVSLSLVDHEPARLLMGDGWGRFPDDVFKYALLDGIYAFHDGERSPNWFLVDGHAFHSHDEITETMLSLGLPGMILWLLLPMIAIGFMPSRIFWWCMPMLLAVIALQSFWFFLPQVLAYQALMWVALSARWYPRHRKSINGKWLATLCVVIAVIMSWSASEQWQAMRYGEILSHAITDDPAEDYSVDWLLQDLKRGGDRLRAGAVFYGDWVSARAANHEVNERDAEWYLLFMRAAHKAAQSPQAGAWLTSLDMWLQNRLFMNMAESKLDTLKPEAKQTLADSAICVAGKAPLREDVTAPFLYSLDDFTGGDDKKSLEILQKILAVAPDQRAALWVMGQELMKIPGRQEEGRAMMKRAADMGVERVFPVTSQELEGMRRMGE